MSLRLSWLEISGKSSIKVEDFSSEKPAWISQPAIELTPKSSIPILITWYPHAYSINITIPSWFYSHDILMIIPITKNRMWMDYFQTYPGLPPIWHHILILISHYTNKNTIMVRPQTIAKLTYLTSLAIWLLFASYLVIMVYVMFFFPWYNHCFPNTIHRVCTNQHRVARGLRLGDLQGRHGTSLVNPIIEVEKTGCWFEIFWKMCYDFPY